MVEAVNKKIGIIAIIIVVILGSIGLVRFFTKEDQNTTLTVVEKKWIEDNKNNVIDFAILNNVPIVSNNGSGIFFDFINSLSKDTKLAFNKISYETSTDTIADYSLSKKDNPSSNDLLLYQDNYILITNEKQHFTDISELNNLKIGCLKNTTKKLSDSLLGSTNLTYQEYDTAELLLTALNTNAVNAIALPKLDYLETILTSKNLHIAYNIPEYKINYVITLGTDEKLNKINIT